MSSETAVDKLNRQLARKINDEARTDPQSKYAGRFVGISQGSVIAVADDLDALAEQLQQAGANPDSTLCFEAGLDYDEVQHIWSRP